MGCEQSKPEYTSSSIRQQRPPAPVPREIPQQPQQPQRIQPPPPPPAPAPEAEAMSSYSSSSGGSGGMAPSGDKLPVLLGRLNKPDSDWDKWSITELTRWCRESIRSRPYQSSIAVLMISHENGALLDLVSESFNGDSLQSDAALRLRKGRADVPSALSLSRTQNPSTAVGSGEGDDVMFATSRSQATPNSMDSSPQGRARVLASPPRITSPGGPDGMGSLSATFSALQAAMADAARAQAEVEAERNRDALAWAEERSKLLARINALEAKRGVAAAEAEAAAKRAATELAGVRNEAASAWEAREAEWTSRCSAIKTAAREEVAEAHRALQDALTSAAAAQRVAEEVWGKERSRLEGEVLSARNRAANDHANAQAALRAEMAATVERVREERDAAVAIARREGAAASAALTSEWEAKYGMLSAEHTTLEKNFKELLEEYDSLEVEEATWTVQLRNKDDEIARLRANLSTVSDVLQTEVEKARLLDEEMNQIKGGSTTTRSVKRHSTRSKFFSWSPTSAGASNLEDGEAGDSSPK